MAIKMRAVLIGVALCVACGGGDANTLDASDAASVRDTGSAVDSSADVPAGGDLPNGSACMTASQCESGFCADGVCCNSACSDQCRSCALTGRAGTCSTVASAPDPDTCEAGKTCDASGVCLTPLGAACTASVQCASGSCVDGVCCNETCGTCQACNLPGTVGNCAPVPKLTDAPGCSGEKTCDGAGTCKLKSGEPCPSGTATCASGFCADGLCCAEACRGTCRTCAAAGKEGTCSPLAGQDDGDADVLCAGTQTCDVAGTCKLKDAQPCATPSDCAANACRPYYADGDKDGYGAPASAIRRCGATPNPPSGYVVDGTDCCDADARVHPGQVAFFSSVSACGSFDYNCNIRDEIQNAICAGSPSAPACGDGCYNERSMALIYTQACR